LNGLETPIRFYFLPQLDWRANLGLIFIRRGDACIVFSSSGHNLFCEKIPMTKKGF